MFIKTELEIQTAGDGFWSNVKKLVKIYKIEILEDKQFNVVSVNLFFTKKSWDVKKHGLIYTDSLFLKNIRKVLSQYYNDIKFNWRSIDYTEQGMQGDNYVSMEICD